MKFLAHSSILLTLTALSTGCVVQSAMTLVPGAAEMKFTTNVADITGCSAVGFIPFADMNAIDGRLRQNEAVALNANIVYDTGGGVVAIAAISEFNASSAFKHQCWGIRGYSPTDLQRLRARLLRWPTKQSRPARRARYCSLKQDDRRRFPGRGGNYEHR
jgi:hypothetical protein